MDYQLLLGDCLEIMPTIEAGSVFHKRIDAIEIMHGDYGDDIGPPDGYIVCNSTDSLRLTLGELRILHQLTGEALAAHDGQMATEETK
jgi:hypothetical protein